MIPRITKNIITAIIIFALVLPFSAVPINHSGVQRAHAIATTEVGPLLSIEAGQLKIDGLKLILANGQNFKEYVLDPLTWALINTVITNMLQELTRWVNSGFQGEPAFITDLEGFLLDAMDEAAGEFLADRGLEFLCSPFRLDVKIALNITYQQARNNTAAANECRLTDMAGNVENFLQGTFSEGGWASWFELTMSPTNDPNRAFLENRARLRIRLLDAYGRELTEVAAKDFFLDVKICEGKGLVVETSNSKAPKDCIVTTPGRIVETQVNESLGLPRQRLAFADEFDELVGALLAQLANQALMGINGLLGLGGSSYSTPVYGDDGDQTYLDALDEEVIEQVGGVGALLDAIDNEEKYRELMEKIVAMVDGVEKDLKETKTKVEAEAPGCFNVRMSPELTDWRDNAQIGIINADNNLIILNDLFEDYTAATTTDAQSAVIKEFNKIQSEIIAGTQVALIQAEIDIDYLIPDDIATLRSQIASRAASCKQSNSR